MDFELRLSSSLTGLAAHTHKEQTQDWGTVLYDGRAVGGDSFKPPNHWSVMSPVSSMVPGFVLMPLVTSSL
jgi:hypothetical protein